VLQEVSRDLNTHCTIVVCHWYMGLTSKLSKCLMGTKNRFWWCVNSGFNNTT